MSKTDQRTAYYSTEQAAYRCGCSSARIRQLLISGEIQGTKVGSVWIIAEEEVQRIAEKLKPGPTRRKRARQKK